MPLHVPDTVYSPQDLTSIIAELHSYAAWFAHNDIKLRAGAKSASTPPPLSSEALETIKSSVGTKLLTHPALLKIISELEAIHRTAPVISLTLAGPVAGELKHSLVASCRRFVADGALVTFKINRSILGGMVLVYGSHVHDWSFRRRLLEQKDAFPEILKRV